MTKIAGVTTRGRTYLRTPEAERFWAKVSKTPTCWLWIGAKHEKGYGRFARAGGTKIAAHRWAYEDAMGCPVPAELTIDHLCRNVSCVNPAHLEPVTIRENVQRGYAARRAERSAA